jgi:hypothetical protein
MRRQVRTALAGGLVLGLASVVGAAPGAQRVQWAESWEKAKEEAEARNVPIYISFHMDN